MPALRYNNDSASVSVAQRRSMPTPKPGRPVRGSRSGQPIMALLDLLGRRWALRIVWELREGSASFRELQARCDAVSPSVLNQRLGELREAGIIELRAESGYQATPAGLALLKALAPLNTWAIAWAKREGVQIPDCKRGK